jgi:hypothetical protein
VTGGARGRDRRRDAGVVAIAARVAGMELKRNRGYLTAECDGRRASTDMSVIDILVALATSPWFRCVRFRRTRYDVPPPC